MFRLVRDFVAHVCFIFRLLYCTILALTLGFWYLRGVGFVVACIRGGFCVGL